MEGWKVPGQPLKLSPVIPVVKVVENGRLEGTRAATKASPFIPVVKIVENGRLEGTEQPLSSPVIPVVMVVAR